MGEKSFFKSAKIVEKILSFTAFFVSSQKNVRLMAGIRKYPVGIQSFE